MATNAARNVGMAYDGLAKSVERLSSGLRINSAKDDAAGLAVRELIRADIAVLQQGARNANDGISMFQTMEAAMGVMDENLVRMKELAEQAATGSYSAAQRTIMDNEFAEMANEIERIAHSTKFNNIAMLNETANTDGSNDVKIHVGTTTTIDVQRANMTKAGLDIETGDGGWQIDTAATNTSSTDSFLSVQSTTAVSDTVSLVVQFTTTATGGTNESAITATFASQSTGASTYSLAQVAAAINVASNNLGFDASGNDLRYSAAEVHYDSTSSTYQLRLSSRDSEADGIALSTAATAAGAMSGGLTLADYTVTTVYDDSAELTALGYTTSTGVTQAGLNIKTVDAAISALSRLETAINTKDTARAAFGYKMNRLESTIAILDIQAENLMAAESRISDVDVAGEMAKLTSSQVLSQAGIAMLAQANSMPQMALTLLR
jgi:flagellin